MKNEYLQFFYYEKKYFEDLFRLILEFRAEHNPEIEVPEKEDKEHLAYNANSKYYRYYICAIDGVLVGHVWFGQQDSDRNKGFVDELYVKPPYRKRGIATSLLTEAIRWIKSKGCSAIEIDVRSQNIGALRLTKEMGFSERAPAPDWISLSMDLIV